jgi:hypothetical protein
MVVRRDEARHDDGAGTIDDLGIAGGYRRGYLGDPLAVDQHIGLVEVADSRIETQDHPAAQQDAAALAVADQSLQVGVGAERSPSPWAAAVSGDRPHAGSALAASPAAPALMKSRLVALTADTNREARRRVGPSA